MKVINKDIAVLVKQATSQGWEVSNTKSNHLKWIAPSGAFFYSPSTPSDYRSIRGLKRDLKVNGFVEIVHKKSRRTK